MASISPNVETSGPAWLSSLAAVVWQPSVVFGPFVIVGFFLWLSPSMEGAAGYHVREHLSLASLTILVVWYGTIAASAAAGQFLARSLPQLGVMKQGRLSSEQFYKVLSAVAAAGVALAWLAAIRGGVSIVELVKTQQFNLVKEALYENYNHLYSLRYTASLAGGYAIYRIVFLRQMSWLDVLNLVLLVAAAAISARILLVQAVVFSGGIAVRFGAFSRVSTRAIGCAAAALAVCLVAFTWVRSAGSYREYFGVRSPIAITYLEVQRYLGAPVQASVGVARIAAEKPQRGTARNLIKYLTPTFLHPASQKVSDNSGGVGEQWYLDQVDVDQTLTTNSAWVEMYGDLGFLAFPVIAWVSFCMSTIGSYFWRAENLLCMIGCIVLYGFFELWRTYYFSAGSFTFLILAVCVAATGGLLLQTPRSRAW